MMNAIYASAIKLMVWLGPEADDSSLAMEELQYLGAGLPYDKMPIISGPVLTAVEKLLTRRWWSRIWIIQEVFWGGLGRKIQEIRVRCGKKEVWWVNIVVAATRMQAHADDQRQYYPAIENILRLEELRNQSEFIVNSVADEMMVLDLVAMYRHFQATDPRDKIYALMGVVFGEGYRPYPGIQIDYSMNTRELYMNFAVLALQNEPGLEILRHCCSSAMEMLPSWVPDWSFGRVEKPLPGRKFLVDKGKPWWLEVENSCNEDESENQDSPVFIEEGPGKGLQLNMGLPGDIQLNTIPKSFADTCPPEFLNTMKELMDAGHLVVASTNDAHEDEVISTSDHKQIEDIEKRIIRRSERITHQNIESKNKAFSANPVIRYAAAGDTTANISVNQTSNTLEVEGLLFDVVDQTC
ncbi:hypothetical protein BGZ60DRAFT_405970 [Tricladium varicosporioides]|nr:hypothetical protein BGZ60DRAFT_405970 [Hymenoscyphus varicosporioides]